MPGAITVGSSVTASAAPRLFPSVFTDLGHSHWWTFTGDTVLPWAFCSCCPLVCGWLHKDPRTDFRFFFTVYFIWFCKTHTFSHSLIPQLAELRSQDRYSHSLGFRQLFFHDPRISLFWVGWSDSSFPLAQQLYRGHDYTQTLVSVSMSVASL